MLDKTQWAMERKLDPLGRIVLPAHFRAAMGLKKCDVVRIEINTKTKEICICNPNNE